jgi:putative ABC transport system permease protein
VVPDFRKGINLLGLIEDIRRALRRMSKYPGVAFTAVLTVALGIGATTLVYSVVQAVLLNSLPFANAEQLFVLSEAEKGQDFSVPWLDFQDWQAQAHSFDGMAGYALEHFQYFDGTHTTLARAGRVSADFFRVLQVQAIDGRAFTGSEDRPGGAPVAVLSYQFWQNQLHGADTAVGSTLDLSGQAYTIIGIMPAGFQFFYGRPADFYIPLGPKASDPAFNSRSAHGVRVLARLRAGVTEAAARAEMEALAGRLALQYPATNRGRSVVMERLVDKYFAAARPVLWLLLAAVMLVLLVACANVSNLLLAQGAERGREYSIRNAIGAGRCRIIRQSLAETLCLALIGGGGGVLLAYCGLPLVLRMAPQNIPRLDQTAIRWSVLVFAWALSVFVSILCAVLPAIASLQIRPEQALKISTTLATHGKQAVRNFLLGAGVAVTVVLTAGTGLLVQSLRQALSADPGFEPQRLLSLDIVLTDPKYKNPAAASAFFTAASEKVSAVPGVEGVGRVLCPPMAGDCWENFYSIPGRTNPGEANLPVSLFNVADARYFRIAGINLLMGRTFSSTDTEASSHVAIVNRAFARRWWPDENAIGHAIRYGSQGEAGNLLEIIGVVGDVRQFGLDSLPEPEVFLPESQQPREAMVLMVRTLMDPNIVAVSAEDAIHDVDREVPVRIHPMSSTVAESLRQRKFLTVLLALFAGAALILAAFGTFGVAAYFVAPRKAEIGLRVALGATANEIKWWVSAQTLRSVFIGCAIGIVGCLALLRLIRSLLVEVSPTNPVVLIGTCALLIVVALIATWLPTHRAASVDPIKALRAE